jgi:hypothetical protein
VIGGMTFSVQKKFQNFKTFFGNKTKIRSCPVLKFFFLSNILPNKNTVKISAPAFQRILRNPIFAGRDYPVNPLIAAVCRGCSPIQFLKFN